jgi:acyl-homoserine lactone acylase PvdQ
VLALVALAVPLSMVQRPASAAATWTAPGPAYRLNDTAKGDAMSILPAGENGLVTASQLSQFEANGTRPAASQDQLAPYVNLIYNSQNLNNSQLPTYYNDESFGIAGCGTTLPCANVVRTETPSSSTSVVIYRDKHDVPHIYGQTQSDVAYGAGYAAAEDRLFLIDVLRHYGAGNLSMFLGPSCADERMDHDALLLGGYTAAQKQAQIDNLPAKFGALGTTLKTMVYSFIGGINAYIAATQTNSALLPAEYPAVTGAAPQTWTVGDVIDLATLLGGIFGKGGGSEVRNAATLQYLQKHFSAATAGAMFTDLKEQNDPDAPTTASGNFPYEIPGTINPALTAMPDDASAPLTGTPTDTTSGCNVTSASPKAMGIIGGMLQLPTRMSNALLVDAKHSSDGHPIAVFGPQVGYYAPEILMEEDLHATDGTYDAQGASFPGTNFLVELGRGRNFAWSATSAETDNVDQRLEQICVPGGGTPQPNGTSYLYNGTCTAMTETTFTEMCTPKPGGQGQPVTITHNIFTTVHGVVQGWTTAGGKPVAVVNQRSTWGAEVDSGIGFMRWAMPTETTDVNSWMTGASAITYTFNWFYIDTSSIGYYQSGLLPLRPSGVDPNLPTSGTGVAEWQGFLGFSGHAHQVGSPTGYITSWNNKGAPQFSAADDNYAWGSVFRVLSLNQEIQHQFSLHNNLITRANLVTAMETAASVDLSGRQVLSLLLPYLSKRSEPYGVKAMLNQLQLWLNAGALRRKAAPGDTQYANGAAVSIMDELAPALDRAFFDSIFSAGGVYKVNGLDAGYNAFPMGFEDNPSSRNGSAYISGFDGYDVKLLRELSGIPVGQPYSSATAAALCGGTGLSGCGASIDHALVIAYSTLKYINGNPYPSSWVNNGATKATGTTVPVYDQIHFAGVGIVGQPAMDWQNRPTFQQVIEFP